MPHETLRPVLTLAPGIRVVEVPSPFDIGRRSAHGDQTRLSGEPPTAASTAPPWSFIVSFPAQLPPDNGGHGRPIGFITRVNARLMAGDARFSYIAADWRELGGEARLRRGESHVDLLTDDLNRWVAVMLRVGAKGPEVAVRFESFECFAIPEEDDDAWQMPLDARLEPVSNWNHAYGIPEAFPARVRHLRFQRLTEPQVMRWLMDLDITLSPGDQISQAIYVSGLYEPCTMTALRHLLEPGDTFVDVGANIGPFSLVASQWVGPSGRVISLEPSSREFGRLRDNIQRNRLTNISAHRVAAGARAGDGHLHVAAGAYTGLNTLEPSFMYAGISEDHLESVPIVTLDELLAQAGGVVDVVKIDVEGAEQQVIAGARMTLERDRPVVLIEVAGPALAREHEGRKEIERDLAGLGYQFAAIDGRSATIVEVPDLAHEAENLVAAQPQMLEKLLRAFRSA